MRTASITAIVRAVVALVASVALVVGVPTGLIALIGNPFPSEIPNVDEIRVLLTQNGDGFTAFVLGTLAVFVWILWAQLMVAMIVEVIANLRNAGTPKLPTAPGIQQLASWLIAPLLLTATLASGPVMAPAIGALVFDEPVSVESALGAPASPAADLAPTRAMAFDRSLGGSPSSQRSFAGISRVSSSSGSSFTLVDNTDPGHDVVALTVSDEVELWDLAEAAYGDGISWKQIASANAGALDASGDMITADTEVVAAGTVLLLPAPVDIDAVASHGTVDPSAIGATTPRRALRSTQPADRLDEHDEHAAGGRVHVVESGDSMWTIAESEVEGHIERDATEDEIGRYWADVVAANQNVPSGNVDLIHPGDGLTMPAFATIDGEAPVEEMVEAAPPAVPVGEPAGDGMRAPGDAPPEGAASGSAASGATAVVDGPLDLARSAPSAPADSAPADAAADSSAERTPAPPLDEDDEDPEFPVADMDEITATAETGGPGNPGNPGDPHGRLSLPAVGMAAMGAAILSAGVVGAVRRRRDLQRRMRPAGTIARAPSSASAAFEAAMLHASDQLVQSRTGLGWRMLPAAAVGSLRAGAPLEFRVGTTGDLSIVTLADPDAAATDLPETADTDLPDTDLADTDLPDTDLHAAVVGGAGGAGGMIDLTSGPEIDQPSEPGDSVAPATIVIGTDPVSGDAVLLDLASVGMLDVRGRAGEIRRFVRGVVLDLAVSDRCDDLVVVAVGVAHELDDLERVRCAADLADALDQVSRCAHTSDSTTPVVVVVCGGEADNDGQGRRRSELDELRSMGALVVAPGSASADAIELDGDTATIVPAGTTVTVAAFDDHGYRSVAELVDTTKRTSTETVDVAEPLEQVIDIAATATCDIEPGPIEVKVLGPVTIVGADSFSSIKAVDVVAYLAFHRHGVDADQIKTWVWPAFDPPTDKAFANVMSRARTALGTDDEGAPFVSRAGPDRTYRLSPAVTTDFDRFRAIVERVDEAATDTTRLALLKQALELIRGVPFTGGAASSFVWADNHVRARVEFTIDEAVHRCADLAIELGELATARWAALKGLELVPGCEQCFRRRFLIAGADKNRTELRRAMADLEASAAVDLGEPEAADIISGDLLDLYHQLDRALVSGAAAGS